MDRIVFQKMSEIGRAPEIVYGNNFKRFSSINVCSKYHSTNATESVYGDSYAHDCLLMVRVFVLLSHHACNHYRSVPQHVGVATKFIIVPAVDNGLSYGNLENSLAFFDKDAGGL